MRFVCLTSTGIDSPVATYMMARYGEVVMVHADNRPFIDEKEIERFKALVSHLTKKINRESKIYVLDHGKGLSAIKKECRSVYTCILCKRLLLKYASLLAEKEKADAIVTGDSLGQVASQTLRNMMVEQHGIKTPVLRPLIGFDKEEIVGLAKEIGTYDLSIKRSVPCSAVPKHPSTRADLKRVLFEEKKLQVNALVESIVDGAKVFKL
ncbi:MAG: hypothetical protein DRN01_00510 [Thermoplasmata archaeon]|nr:MAG: hypothetical protein DRN01_00510 [Thermoplasmata archaeon]